MSSERKNVIKCLHILFERVRGKIGICVSSRTLYRLLRVVNDAGQLYSVAGTLFAVGTFFLISLCSANFEGFFSHQHIDLFIHPDELSLLVASSSSSLSFAIACYIHRELPPGPPSCVSRSFSPSRSSSSSSTFFFYFAILLYHDREKRVRHTSAILLIRDSLFDSLVILRRTTTDSTAPTFSLMFFYSIDLASKQIQWKLDALLIP